MIKKFEVAKTLKRRLRERYVKCKDISEERKAVIDQFLYDEYRKYVAVTETLWSCVNQIQAQISNNIRWSFEENVEAADAPRVQGASTSSAAPVVVEQQQQQHHLDHFQLSFEENVAADDGGWND